MACFLHTAPSTIRYGLLTRLLVLPRTELKACGRKLKRNKIGNASARGALVKGGKYIEAIGRVKAVAMDKTRTLTYGKPKVTDVIPFGETSREHLLACAGGIESYSEHPLATAIVAAANAEERAFWVRVIEKGDQRDGDLDHALALMAKHGAMVAARADAMAWAARAQEALGQLPNHDLRQMLHDLSAYVVSRLA